MLILAGVALATLTGDSGILSNADKAKENTNVANVKEKVQLAIMEHKVGQYSEGKTLKEYLEAAGATDVTEAGTKGKMDGYNFEIEDGVVTVTKQTTEPTGKLKLKDVYTEEMIGQTINYKTTNALPEDVELIVIGVESMDLDHVNALTGFTEPTFNTYTFRDQTDNDYANKIVNYYHPDATSANSWSKNTKPYDCDAYLYGRTETGLGWFCEETGFSMAEYIGELNNLDFILGTTENPYAYVLASRFVGVDSYDAYFNVGIVARILCVR